jgi:hypothetical protein
MIMAIFIGGIGATVFATCWLISQEILYRRSKSKEREQND